ncbi:ferritin-like domain-containing protein [Helicobacter sp. MIT 21-1697]|uniref:ferritin-like domain-containing protein n=1 Tax=Helicobacter sp. MIT 21-1697 TaxID=2993733 RepID=UPI00224AAB81|nr:ferritin-like domain-containing protein [Helicobacter sp. MIT 21-1697]MCX2717379.1 ferritin-like domain-containing protein [Helicobacter sp. MIT 21-1697]
MNLFALSLEALNAPSIESKLSYLEVITSHKHLLCEQMLSSSHHNPSALQSPSYAGFCKIIHPTKIRRPKHIKSIESFAKVLHSIVHIEYSAIDLALDALTRFKNLPLSYYDDWLEVALQESLHFRLLRECLNILGYEYGDFPVHSQLFDAQVATPDFSNRMALLHRGLEANGLDANPFVANKVKAFEHSLTPKVLEILQIILHDEIEHVKKGDKWWRFANTQASAQDFVAILKHFEAFRPISKVLHYEARLQAGFSPQELEMMSILS